MADAPSAALRRFEGQRALVTGGARGIGAAIAVRLADEGARVVIADLDLPAAEQLAARIGAKAVALDVSDVAAVARAVAEHGPFTVLVNNAGVDQHAFFTDTLPEEWQGLIGVNLVSVLATTHAVLPAMQQAGYGRIVNIASEAGRMGSRGGSVYAAAKGGVIAFSRSIARESARKGVTVNVVAPGPIDTPLLRSAVEAGGDRLLGAMTAATLAGRLGTPEEVAAAVAFLASPEAGFVTGEVLGVSGGMGVGT